jgi:hypothetical protein
MTAQACQFALDPAPEQEVMLRSHCGGQRYACNWGLARVKVNLGQREAEKSYEITAAGGAGRTRIIRGPGTRPALSSGRWDGGARSLRR